MAKKQAIFVRVMGTEGHISLMNAVIQLKKKHHCVD